MAAFADALIPNLAAGVPRFADHERIGTVGLTARQVGTLAVPSRTLALQTGTIIQETFPIAGDALAAIACDARGSLAAWVLRVEGAAAPIRWQPFGFGEDCCSLGDAAASTDVEDGGWPPWLIGFARSTAGGPLLCVSGPDLTQAHGAAGLDADDRVTTIVVVN